MDSARAKQSFIENLRKRKFGIGTHSSSSLATELHQAIIQLSVELYQNDIQFITELLQNAEDNSYDADVSPSLELILSDTDVAKVGASATLLVFNNERGLSDRHVQSLCSIGSSTKKSSRDKGLIGCKGIGFKSVYMVTREPHIISNGFRLKFSEEPHPQAGVGYIVPESTITPTDAEIRSVSGHSVLPTTSIILPLRQEKISVVRKHLRKISPETLLFLTKIRQVRIRDQTTPIPRDLRMNCERVCSQEYSSCKSFTVHLSVEGPSSPPTLHQYYVSQQSFPVSNPTEHRQGISRWMISLAFPFDDRAPSNSVGDVFSFLPTALRSGFPFLINADFLLVSSRETIRFDSPWNIGILGCIPSAFKTAFNCLLFRNSDVSTSIAVQSPPVLAIQNTYRYVPARPVESAYGDDEFDRRSKIARLSPFQPNQVGSIHHLEEVRRGILRELRSDSIIIVSRRVGHELRTSEANTFRKPRHCRQMEESFRKVVETAANEGVVCSVLRTSSFYVVDGGVQMQYGHALDALGVLQMKPSQYLNIFADSTWLMKLSEDLYAAALAFLLLELDDDREIPQVQRDSPRRVVFANEKKVGEAENELSGDDDDDENSLNSVEWDSDFDDDDELESSSDVAEATSQDKQSKSGVPVLKYMAADESIALASLDRVSKDEGMKLRYCPPEEGEWLSQWTAVFREWYPMYLIPEQTIRALREHRRSDSLMARLKKRSVSEITVKEYARKLMDMLSDKSKPLLSSLSRFAILVPQFLLSAIFAKRLILEDTVNYVRSRNWILVSKNAGLQFVHYSFRSYDMVLVPYIVGKWSLLLQPNHGNDMDRLIVLSDDYIKPQSSLCKLKGHLNGELFSIKEFLEQAFRAADLPRMFVPDSIVSLHPTTEENSSLLLEWLKISFPRRSKPKTELFVRSIQSADWLKTTTNEWKRPKLTFLFCTTFFQHFRETDLPFVDGSFYTKVDFTEYEKALQEVGVITLADAQAACRAVVKYFSGVAAGAVTLEVCTRMYKFLHSYQFNGKLSAGDTVKIWTPASNNAQDGPFWKRTQECFIQDKDQLFHGRRVALDRIYGEEVLVYFREALEVPQEPPVKDYCELWVQWRDESHKPSYYECVRIWRKISEGWEKCDKITQDEFIRRAWVPTTSWDQRNDSLKKSVCLKDPGTAFFPDSSNVYDLHFPERMEKLNFVWFPSNSQKWSSALQKLYTTLGVQRLSSCIIAQVLFPLGLHKQRIATPNNLYLCEGLFRAVIGFLCKRQHHFTAAYRKELLLPLISGVTEVAVTEPFESHLTLGGTFGDARVSVVRQALACWDKAHGKLYYLRRDHPLLRDEAHLREFHSQIARTIAEGVLPRHPNAANGLGAFLKLLLNSRFDKDSVEHELRHSNLIVLKEDAKFLTRVLEAKELSCAFNSKEESR